MPPILRDPIAVLHLVYGFMPSDPRVKREALAIAGTGRRVAVVSLTREGQRPVERFGPLLLVRLPGRKSRGGFVSYLAEYAEFVLRCYFLVRRHRRLHRVRLVHVHTLPDFLMAAALPARRRGARTVFDMHEIFPEFVRAKFPGIAGATLGAAARLIERWARRRGDLTITVNRPIAALLAQRPSHPGERRLLVHNTADPQDFGGGDRPGADYRPTLPVRLIYHGTLTRLYGLDIAIRGVARARAAGLDVTLTILGDGPERPALDTLARSLFPAGGVDLLPPVPHEALRGRLLAHGASLIPTRLDGMTRYSLSTKLLECVYLGLPVIAARLPGYQAYFPETAMWFWTPGDDASLAQAIAAFAAAGAPERARRADEARRAVSDIGWPVERDRLLAAYDELLGHTAPTTAAIRSAAVPSP